MDFATSERDRRWTVAREIMARHGVDVVIATSDLGDIRGHQRYLSGYRATFDDVATLIFADGGSVIILGHPATVVFAKDLSWVTEPLPAAVAEGMSGPPNVGGGIANALKSRGVTRIGVAGLERFPCGWHDTILAVLPEAQFVDLDADMLTARLVKSDPEIDCIREAARISDMVWAAIPELVQIGRKRYEVMADIEHILRSQGCEENYALFEALPLLSAPKDRRPYSALPIEEGQTFCIEVSPRYLGYYAQQTSLVSIGEAPPEDMRRAFDGANRARDAGLKLIKPGVDIMEVTAAVDAQLRADGLEPAAPVIGHFVGLELEEARVGHLPHVLEAGMTLILHPFIAGHPAVLRADTYLVTETGIERLTTGQIAPYGLHGL